MRKRPLILTIMAVAFVAVALSFPLQIMLIYDHGLNETREIFSKLTIFNWLIIIGCLICSVLIARASPHCRRAIPALTALVAINNAIVGYYAIDFSAGMATVATLIFALFNVPLFTNEIRELMMHPERRWWLRRERFRRQIPVVVTGALRGRSPVRAATFDLSETGLFIPVPETHFEVDDRISVRLTFGTFSQIRCDGRIARRAPTASGIYPSGIAIQFTDMDWRQRRELRHHIERAGAPASLPHSEHTP